jgi:hypothetical protein
MKSKITFNRKSLNSFISSHRDRPTSTKAAFWKMLKSTTPAATSLFNTLNTLRCGHPSFKRRGNFFHSKYFNTALKLTEKGRGAKRQGAKEFGVE